MAQIDTIVLATKDVKAENGRVFPVYFAYRQEKDENGEYTDILTPYTGEDGSPQFKAKPIKVKLTEDFEKKLKDSKLEFPLMMRLDDTLKVNVDGKAKSSYFVTLDTERDTRKPRLDKYGRQHLILVIRDAVDIREKPRTSYSLEDVDEF